MFTGWIKLYRNIRESEIFNNEQLLRLWLICLTEATYKECSQRVGSQTVHLMPGEFVTGRFEIHELYNNGLKPTAKVKGEKTVYRWLEKLEEIGCVTIKKTSKYSVISIVGWSDYQQNDQQKIDHLNDHSFDHENDQQKTSGINGLNGVSEKVDHENDHLNVRRMTTKEEVKEIKNNNTSIQQAEQFSLWWNLYNKKIGKAKCETKFKQLLKKYSYSQIEDGTKKYLDYMQQNNTAKQYQKNPLTFLNGEHFNDEYESSSSPGAPPTSKVQVFQLNMED